MYRHPHFVQVQTPGSKDIIVFEKQKKGSRARPKFHFGFRLTKASSIKSIIRKVEDAGGKIRKSGEFVPGGPYVFFYDPDGYEVEIWFEKIPPELKSFK